MRPFGVSKTQVDKQLFNYYKFAGAQTPDHNKYRISNIIVFTLIITEEREHISNLSLGP